MKLFLRLMGQLCPLSSQYKTKLTAMTAVMTLFMCLIAAFKAPAQTGGAANMDEIRPLQIGDTIPEELWHLPLQVVNHPEGRDTITLNDYRDKKLIILDFWATWCVPCIRSLHHLDTLQNQFSSELAVIPITYEMEEKVERLFENMSWSFPSITRDSMLKNYFPHGTVPHQIWIQEDRVIGVGSEEYASATNVSEAIQGRELKMLPHVYDPDITMENLMDYVLNPNNEQLIPKSFRGVLPRVKGEVSGVSFSSSKFQAVNFPVVGLYQVAFNDIIPFSEKDLRLSVEILDEVTLRRILHAGIRTGNYEADFQLEQALDTTLFTYILVSELEYSRDEVADLMKQDLDDYFGKKYGIVANIEDRPIPCYVLSSTRKESNSSSLSKKPILQQLVFENPDKLISALRYQHRKEGYYFLNGLDSLENGPIELDSNLLDLGAVNNQLVHYGLRLVKENQNIPVLVIAERGRK